MVDAPTALAAALGTATRETAAGAPPCVLVTSPESITGFVQAPVELVLRPAGAHIAKATTAVATDAAVAAAVAAAVVARAEAAVDATTATLAVAAAAARP